MSRQLIACGTELRASWMAARTADRSVPDDPQLIEEAVTFRLEAKLADEGIISLEIPLRAVAMLEHHVAREIRLEERSRFEARGARGHRVGLVYFSEGEVKSLLVAVDVPVVEIRVVVVVLGEAERLPASLLVDHDLAGLDLGLVTILNAENLPARVVAVEASQVGPEQRPVRAVLPRAEERLGVRRDTIVGVEQQDLAKRTVQNRVRLQFPAAENPRGMHVSHSSRVYALDAQRGDQFLHVFVQLSPAEIPELNGETTADMSEQRDRDPGVGEIRESPTADDDAAAVIYVRVVADGGDELLGAVERGGLDEAFVAEQFHQPTSASAALSTSARYPLW